MCCSVLRNGKDFEIYRYRDAGIFVYRNVGVWGEGVLGEGGITNQYKQIHLGFRVLHFVKSVFLVSKGSFIEYVLYDDVFAASQQGTRPDALHSVLHLLPAHAQ